MSCSSGNAAATSARDESNTQSAEAGFGTTMTSATQQGNERTKLWLQSTSRTQSQGFRLDPKTCSIRMGLGWSAVQAGSDSEIDADASAVLFDRNMDVLDVVWYAVLKSRCGCVVHSGDNRRGGQNGDNETIDIDLNRLSYTVHHIAFVVSVYSDGCLSDIDNAVIRIQDLREQNRSICTYKLPSSPAESMIMFQLTRKKTYWNLRALGAETKGRQIDEIADVPENFACLVDVDSEAPSVREIVLTIESGSNLVAKDEPGWFSSAKSSDPYYVIRYQNQAYRSEHINKSLTPKWKPVPIDLGYVIETSQESVEIEVFDYDFYSPDEFMGTVVIPAADLYRRGVGEFRLAPKLRRSKKPQYKDEDVGGELHVVIRIREVDELELP